MELAKVLCGGGFTILVCYSLGRLCLWRIRAPRAMALPAGAALFSLCVYALLLAGRADPAPLAALGAAALLPLLLLRGQKRKPEMRKREPLDKATRLLAGGVFAAYGVLYLVHALAPELQPDALYYHLGLVNEYARLGAFPNRIDFYGVLPQGMEMLYLFAFTFGGHSAAKLAHFAFLAATPPVMVAIGRRLGLSDRVSWLGAAFYVCAPVVGISATCAYTDGALVCAGLAAFYFLLAWKQEDEARYLIPAGLLAGFCYAIKLSAIVVPALAVGFVLFECRRRPRVALARGALCAAAALAVIAPWMIRAVVLTGNPLAPLFNAWFPNPYFLEATDRVLARFMRTYDGFSYRNAAWELTVGGASHGIVGPLFLLLPVGLLALRTAAGRWLWIAGALFALPWLSNVGTRFLMPALPFFALALAMALPRPLGWAALLFHAVMSWPAVLDRYARPGLWSLHGVPWRAALRIQPEPEYLRATLWDYRIAEMINASARPERRVYALTALSDAYIDREIVSYWQSALGVRLRETLLEAAYTGMVPLFDWTATWPAEPLRALRLRATAADKYEWEIHEASLFTPEGAFLPVDRWQLAAWPNLYEAPFALDRNQATRWRSWEPARPGMYFELDFAAPQRVAGVTVSAHWETPGIEVFGLAADGRWRRIGGHFERTARPLENLRRAAMRQVSQAGIDYIVTPVEGDLGGAWLGKDLADHAAEYGLTEVARYEVMRLYKVGFVARGDALPGAQTSLYCARRRASSFFKSAVTPAMALAP